MKLRAPILCVLALLLWGVYLHRLSPSVGVGDSGEFITGAVTLSLPHAPSYPLFSLAGKAFHGIVPFGNSAYRLNLMSAFFGLLSAVLIFLVARRIGLSSGAGLLAAALAAGSPAFFHNALVTEVFAMNAFLALAVFHAALSPARSGGVLAAFLFGLGMGNHQTIAFAAPGAALLLWRAWRREDFSRRDMGRFLLLSALAFAAGLSVYGYLPARSLQDPPLNWGRPQDLDGILRSFLRKDYGTLSLALGEQPARGAASAFRQWGRYFTDGVRDQFTWAGAGGILLGFWAAWKRDRWTAVSLAAAWAAAGPFFAWLGNLPFDAQSRGVLERFYILPAVFGVFGAGYLFDAAARRWRPAAALLFVLPLFIAVRSAQTYPLRGDFLAQDYARSVFRTLPPGAAFFMDGGDDTFFTSAFQRFVQRQRPDLRLFDRGGLVFAGAYGPDFRSLDKRAKDVRRREVERRAMARGPLFYSTMDEKILGEIPLGQAGFLYRAGGDGDGGFLWEIYALRSLYPPASPDYRTRALAPYFPFLRARAAGRAGDFQRAEEWWDRAWRLGPDVPWLRNNLAAEFLEAAYGRLRAGDWAAAERLSRKCLSVDPRSVTALGNLGVIAERRNDLDDAAVWYGRALDIAPRSVDVLYNLSVVRWRQGAWDKTVPLLEQVLRLQPDHAQALHYLPLARRKLAERGQEMKSSGRVDERGAHG